MKKYFIIIGLFLISFLVISCGPISSVFIAPYKEEIAQEKYGELEYIIEGVVIYKNLKSYFNHVDGIDYILKNSGNRGCVEPELAKNFYVLIDLVKQEDKYKILVYDSLMKKSANKNKMFVLTDNFLPLNLDKITHLLESSNSDSSLSDYNMFFIKKDSNLQHNNLAYDLITYTYYQKMNEGDVYISLSDKNSSNSIVGLYSTLIFGNEYDEIIYYPESLNYNDYVNSNYDTLNNELIDFSLDKGKTFINTNDKLKEFDIWNEQINTETYTTVFFYAFTYNDFLKEIEKAKNPDFYTYRYLDEEGFNHLKEIYNNDYFKDNILIFYYKYENNISENYIYSVTKDNNVLTLNVNRFEGMAEALSSWLEIITIMKSDIEEVERIDLIVRTIAPQQSSITAYVNKDYIRNFYLNEPILSDFKDLDNLLDIELFHGSLNVDLIFNKTINNDDLNEMIDYLENNHNVKSTGYQGLDFIRVQLSNHLYDKVINKTLVISDFILDKALINEYSLSINILNPHLSGSITFFLDEKGKDKALKMINDLKRGNYPFINEDELYLEYYW